MLSDLNAEAVVPFYLRMMGTRALQQEASVYQEVREVGFELTEDQVIELLGGQLWSWVVMGAWFSCLHETPAVRAQVLAALDNSQGDLTAPPLVVAAVTLCGSDCAEMLRRYEQRDRANEWGAAAFVAAALEQWQVGGLEADADARDDFVQMMSVARSLT